MPPSLALMISARVELSFRVIAAFFLAASSQLSHTVFRECCWYIKEERCFFHCKTQRGCGQTEPLTSPPDL